MGDRVSDKDAKIIRAWWDERKPPGHRDVLMLCDEVLARGQRLEQVLTERGEDRRLLHEALWELEVALPDAGPQRPATETLAKQIRRHLDGEPSPSAPRCTCKGFRHNPRCQAHGKGAGT